MSHNGTQCVFDPAQCAMDDADTAWVLVSTILVFGMIPGLALFEAGLLRLKNSISIITQTLGGLVVLAMLWVLFGYSLVFGNDHGGFVGDFYYGLFMNMQGCHPNSNVTRPVVAIFQMMFACVTPLLITGTVAERMRWKPFLAFVVLWEVFVYYFLAHWVWNADGWLANMGALDFAGGIVIHTSAGSSALVIAHMLGRRIDYDKYHGKFPHSDMRVAVLGAAFLWIGWFGFNAGSALGSNTVAVQAVVNTQIGASFAAGVWMICGWFSLKPSAADIINGAVAGLAGITPASGYISTQAAIVTSIILGLASFYAIQLLHKTRIDDALEVSCVHGLTGLIGAVAIGFAADNNVNCAVDATMQGLFISGSAKLLGVQCLAILVAIVFPCTLTWLMLFIMSKITRLRARETHETAGLDYSHHRLDVIHPEERSYGDDRNEPLLEAHP